MTRRMNRRRFIAFLSGGLAACNPVRNYKEVDAAVEQFHRRLNSDEFDAIYNDLAPVYQRSLDRDTHRKFLTRVRRKMGRLQSAGRIGYQVHYDPQGAFATATYRTTFANGDATEIFQLRIADGKARFLAYTLNSALMLTD
ncbi:MAG: DUF4019 domain-containing protein [Bryobacteraceae bacterium]